MNPRLRRIVGRVGNSLLVLVGATFAVSMLMRLLPVDLAAVLLPTAGEIERRNLVTQRPTSVAPATTVASRPVPSKSLSPGPPGAHDGSVPPMR